MDISHRSLSHNSCVNGKSNDSAKEGDNVIGEVTSDMSGHHSDDLITIFTTEGEGSTEPCQDNTDSQDTASRERGDFVKLNDTKGNVKDELENNQNIKIRTSMLEMNHNDIDGTSTDELHKEEDKEVIKPQLEMEMATANHKITEELSDNIVNKEENNDIEIIQEKSFMAEETPRHGQESDIINSSNEISKDKTVESDAEKEGHVDPSLCLDYQCPTTPPSQGVIPSSSTPAPPSPSQSHPSGFIFQDMKSFSESKLEESEEPPPRPPLPVNIIENLEKKIEIQYKKYPKFEQTPPRTPVPPERSDSQGKQKSVNPSPQNTPILQRKQRISSNMTDTANIQKSGSYLRSKDKNADSISKYKLNSGIFKAKPVLLFPGKENNKNSEDKKSKEEIARIHQLEKEQNNIEEILRKKKEQEHLKRLEFEENRIKEENEKLKIAAEEKKKREEEDARRLQEENEKMMIVGKDKQSEETKESKFKLHNRHVITEDGIALAQDKQEEEKIRIGREVAFREIESNKRNKNIQKKEKVSVHDPNNHYAVAL